MSHSVRGSDGVIDEESSSGSTETFVLTNCAAETFLFIGIHLHTPSEDATSVRSDSRPGLHKLSDCVSTCAICNVDTDLDGEGAEEEEDHC